VYLFIGLHWRHSQNKNVVQQTPQAVVCSNKFIFNKLILLQASSQLSHDKSNHKKGLYIIYVVLWRDLVGHQPSPKLMPSYVPGLVISMKSYWTSEHFGVVHICFFLYGCFVSCLFVAVCSALTTRPKNQINTPSNFTLSTILKGQHRFYSPKCRF